MGFVKQDLDLVSVLLVWSSEFRGFSVFCAHKEFVSRIFEGDLSQIEQDGFHVCALLHEAKQEVVGK